MSGVLNNTCSLTRLIIECDFGFIVNRVLNDTDSLTQIMIKTKWSFNESLIRLKDREWSITSFAPGVS